MDRRCERRSWQGSQSNKRGDNHGPDNAILEQPVNPQPLEFEQSDEQKRLLREIPVEFQAKRLDRGTVGGIA